MAAPVETKEPEKRSEMPLWRMPRPTKGLTHFWDEFYPLRIMNSLTRTKVPFIPINGKRVLWYMCGPTVYDSAHMGHARAYVTFDIVRRIMTDYFGYEVLMAMNITDIDDKIIIRANERKMGFRELAAIYEKEFLDDMKSLGVKSADVLTRVSEYVPGVIDFVKKIIDNGFAYESNGSVYFDTERYSKAKDHTYGKLMPENVGDMSALAEGEGKLVGSATEKRNDTDFALWKRSKEGEPKWESPWGEGRPGWHIECSAMAGETLKDFAGGKIDIHSGGVDLKFPHHDNEIAQSEACFKFDQWVNYWMHAGHLNIDGMKMGKSLKNFTKIGDALKTFTGRQLRFIFLTSKYNTPMDYSADAMDQARSLDKFFNEFFLNVKAELRRLPMDVRQAWGDREKALAKSLVNVRTEVREALSDDFNTPRALQILQAFVREVNVYIRPGAETPIPLILSSAAEYVTSMLSVFGLVNPNPEIGFPSDAGAGGASKEDTLAPYLDALTGFRETVRDAARRGDIGAVLKACDEVRDAKLVPLGVRLEDRAGGSVWKLEDPAILEAELKAKSDAEARAREAKAKRAEEALKAAEAARVDPRDMFRAMTDKYSAFDDDGIPTHDAKGEPLLKSARKKVEKHYRTQKTKFDKAMAKEKK